MIFADVIWPALFFQSRLYSWWDILIGILIEYLFIRALTGFAPFKSMVVTITVNAISSFIGYYCLIALDLLREEVAEHTFYPLLHVGTFSYFGWASAALYYALINAGIECTAMRYIFQVRITSKFFALDTLANFLSVLVVFPDLFTDPATPHY